MTITRLAQYTAETQEAESFSAPESAEYDISSSIVKTGSYSYRNFFEPAQGYMHDSELTQVRCGYWMYMESLNDDIDLFQARYGEYVLRFVADWNDQQLYLMRRNGPLSSDYEILASAVLPAILNVLDNWIHIGVDYNLDSTSGWLYLYVDRLSFFNHDGDTRPARWEGGGGGSQQFVDGAIDFRMGGRWTVNNGITGYIDDVYFDETTGEASPASPPALQFLYSPVSGAGSSSDYTGVGSATNWENVDELPPNGDTDYNEALSSGLVDSFTHAGITLPPNYTLHAAIPLVFAKNLNAGPQIRLNAFDGVNTANGSDQDLNFDYTFPLFERMETQPDGSAWNETDLNDMEFQYESRGTF